MALGLDLVIHVRNLASGVLDRLRNKLNIFAEKTMKETRRTRRAARVARTRTLGEHWRWWLAAMFPDVEARRRAWQAPPPWGL